MVFTCGVRLYPLSGYSMLSEQCCQKQKCVPQMPRVYTEAWTACQLLPYFGVRHLVPESVGHVPQPCVSHTLETSRAMHRLTPKWGPYVRHVSTFKLSNAATLAHLFGTKHGKLNAQSRVDFGGWLVLRWAVLGRCLTEG